MPSRRRAARRKRANPPRQVPQPAAQSRQGVSNRGPRRIQTVRDGIVISQKEHWATITANTTPGSLRMCPGKSGLPLLDALGKVYDNYRLRSVLVEVKGVGPTTADSNLAWALDYKVDAAPTSRSEILGKVPSFVQAAWQHAVVKAGSRRMMRQHLYNTNGTTSSDDTDAFLFTYVASTSGQQYWEVYCSYEVELLNPSPSTN